MRLPLELPLLDTWPATQACALSGNGAGDPLVPRPALNPLSYTNHGRILSFYNCVILHFSCCYLYSDSLLSLERKCMC